jgi:hypothetical protein
VRFADIPGAHSRLACHPTRRASVDAHLRPYPSVSLVFGRYWFQVVPNFRGPKRHEASQDVIIQMPVRHGAIGGRLPPCRNNC